MAEPAGLLPKGDRDGVPDMLPIPATAEKCPAPLQLCGLLL